MPLIKKFVFFGLPLLLIALIAIAGYVYSNIKSLSLPISKALVLFTLFLPIVSGLSTHGVFTMLRRSSNKLSLPLVALFGLQVIYETVIATLALTHMVPPSSLTCGLRDRWIELFRVKDGDAIRAIQDTFNCCGLNTMKDMAWPFGEPSTCPGEYHRTQSCFGAWRRAEQIDAGLLFLIAVVVFVMKVLSITSLLTNSSWARSRLGRNFRPIAAATDEEDAGDDSRATMRRLIEESVADEGYHDDPNHDTPNRSLEGTNGNDDHSPRVVPSILADSGNEWRDEGQIK